MLKYKHLFNEFLFPIVSHIVISTKCIVIFAFSIKQTYPHGKNSYN